MSRRRQLEAEGWRRMNVYDEPRLSELAETYKELGFEVHYEPIHPEELEGCAECIAEVPERYRTIYVRKLAGRGEEDLCDE